MIRIEWVKPSQARQFEHLTFPTYRPMLRNPEDKDLCIAAALDTQGEALAMAFGWGGPRREFELISIYTSPMLRRQGIGKRLLDAVQTGFARKGYRLGVFFHTIDASNPDASNPGSSSLLVQSGWSQPSVRKVLCRTSLQRAFHTPWLITAQLPEHFEIQRWNMLDEEQRAAIRRQRRHDGHWYAGDQDPFLFERDCHHETSLALLRDREVIGWVITHALSEMPDILRWTVSFISPELAKLGLIRPLWLEVARRQARTTHFKQFSWSVPIEHPRMLAFVHRRMKPWLNWMGFACRSVIRLS